MVHPALDDIRADQLGVWTRGQAVATGLAHSTVQRWLTTGRAVELFPGVLAERGQPVDWDVRAVGARLWAGDDAVLARDSAAQALGLRLPSRVSPFRLVVHERTFPPTPGVVVHRTSRPLAYGTSDVGPHRTTDPTRTICDLAGSLGPTALRRLVAHAVRADLTTAGQLRDWMDHLGRFRGKTGLRRVVDELSPLESRTRSELESLFLRVTTPLGLGPDVVNHPVVDAAGDTRILDAAYLPEHLPVELDSKAEHGTLLDWNDDRRRENRIVLGDPWRAFLRFSWQDLTEHATEVAEMLRLALRAAGTTRPL